MQKEKVWDEYKSEKFLSDFVPVVESVRVSTKELTKSSFPAIKFPCFLKIISSKAIHKAKAGLVFELESLQDFKRKKRKILQLSKKYGAKFSILQEKIFGPELIVGIKEDLKFGKLLMIGVGGRFAEKLNDVSFRVLPIKKSDLQSMLGDLYNKAIVEQININLLWAFVQNLQKAINTKEGKKFIFLDLNPVILDSNNKGKPVVVDARIYL